MLNAIYVCSSPLNHHAGVKLVGEGIRYQFDRHGIEVVQSIRHKTLRDNKLSDFDVIPHDLVIVNAEGCLHDDMFPNMVQLAEDFKAVLINGQFFRNTYSIEAFAYTAARDSASAKNMGCKVVPDCIFTAPSLKKWKTKREALEFTGNFVTDSEPHEEFGFPIKSSGDEFLEAIIACSTATIGRFHGICIAAVLGVPFTAYGTTTAKNFHLMKDMGASTNYFSTVEDALAASPKSTRIQDYLDSAPDRIDAMFEEIKAIC